MWFICMIASLGGCSYYMLNIVVDYLNYDVLTEIQLIYEQPSTFPAVSICSRDSYNFTNLDEIIFCHFNYDDQCLYNRGNYFEYFTDAHYGLCYRFNSGKNTSGMSVNIKNVTFSGKENGFLIDIKLNQLADFSKIVVVIHNQTTPPFSMYNKGIEMTSGTNSFIAIHKVFNYNLDLPYSNCLKDPNEFSLNKTLIKYINDSNRTYTQDACFDLCFNLDYIESNVCNCTAPLDKVFEKCYVNEAYYSKLWNCTRDYRTKFSRSKFNLFCPLYCPQECDTMHYDVTSYTLGYRSSGNISENDKISYFDGLYDNYEEIHKSFYTITIYYDDLRYTVIKQKPKITSADLASGLGGLVGVFFGSSFLSLIDFVEILVEIAIILMRK